MVMPSRRANVEGYIDAKYVDVCLTDHFVCKHTKALFIHQILFPNIVWLKNIRVFGGWYHHLHIILSKSNHWQQLQSHQSNTNLVFDSPRMTHKSSMRVAILKCSNTLLEGPYIKLSIGSITSQIR